MQFKQSNERRGVILLVVLSLLTLFAIVGISFVLYADAEAASARIARQAETQQRADVDPQQALAFFLGQLIYDVPDATGYGSALRGHSLARTMYGYNVSTNVNVIPFNGVGRLHTGTDWPQMNNVGSDDYNLINYTWFQGDGFVRDPEWYTNVIQTSPGAARAAGKAYYVGCNAPYTYPDLNNFFLAAVRSDGTVLAPSYHRNYTGFGSLDPTNPNWSNKTAALKYQVLRPRPAEHPNFPAPDDAGGDVKNLVGAPGGNDSIWIDLGAPVMTAPDGTKYKMLFAPLIMDLDNRINLASAGNIVGSGNASLSNQGWYPSEVNLSTLWSKSTAPKEWLNLILGIPNAFSGTPSPGTSYIGKYGPDKPNPIATGSLFPPGTAARVYAQTDPDGRNEVGNNAATAAIQLPGTGAAPATTCFPYFPQGYGCGSSAERITLNSSNEITYRHPAAYTAFRTPLYTTTTVTDANPPQTILNNDLAFQPYEMEALLRPNNNGSQPVDTGSSALISYLMRLCPTSLGGPASTDTTAYRRRNWITTLSADLALPGLSPWIYNPVDANNNPLYVVSTPSLPPSGSPVSFPTYQQRTQALPTGADFTADWRALDAVQFLGSALGRIDLNRPLTPYPHMLANPNNFPKDNDPNNPQTHSMMTTTPNDRFDVSNSFYDSTTITNQALVATTSRQQFAIDIYTRLLAVTGVGLNTIPSTAVATPTSQQLAPRRWLAQLAVNIVDYIDPDEISTPFNFYDPTNTSNSGLPTAGSLSNLQLTKTTNTIPVYNEGNPNVPMYWVFGTELPRVVINEVFGQSTTPAANGTFNANVWVELFNPMPPSTGGFAGTWGNSQTANNSTLQPQDGLPVPLYNLSTTGTPAGGYNTYQLVIADNNPATNSQGLWYDPTGLNNNVLGAPHYNYYVNPTASLLKAGCYFGGPGSGESNPGMAATVAAPLTANYPLYSTTGNWGLYGGLPASQTGQPSYLLVGPSAPAAPGTTPLVVSPNMTYQVTTNAAGAWSVKLPSGMSIPNFDNTNGVSVLLQRLANPHLQENPFQANGTLLHSNSPPNPYITVDYVSGVPLNGAASYGKRQPYAGNISQYVAQTAANTFGSPNSTPDSPFTWLVHLDRNLISPMELLHVSGFHPHELTQRFKLVPNATAGFPQISQPYSYTAANVPANSLYFQHYVPWFDQTNRLYRFFELVETHNGTSGVSAFNGRVPGKININTLWDVPTETPLIYQAICDPPANPNNPNFTAASVATNATSIFQTLLTYRTKNLAANPPTLSASDVPFIGMAAGVDAAGSDTQYSAGLGINNTLFTDGQSTPLATNQRLFQLPNAAPTNPQIAHPYLQNEVLTKIYSRLTTRSNVFAVFLTVGFFQVMTNPSDGSVITVDGQPLSPPQLGPEIGRSEGRQVRHRTFALVDRTQLTAFQTLTAPGTSVISGPSSPSGSKTSWLPTAPGTVQLSPTNSTSNSYQTVTGAPWSLAPGSQMVLEPGTANEETVMVTVTGVSGTSLTFTSNFFLQHPNQALLGNPEEPPYVVIQRGNPGPWAPPAPPYDPRKDPLVVPYFAIID